MDPREKREIRDYIGQYVDLAKTRLSDDDALFLRDIIKNWAEYAGRVRSHTNMGDGWGSDGKYTRVMKTTTTFLKDRVAVEIEMSQKLDGVDHGGSHTVVTTGRGLINLFKSRPHLLDD